MGGALKDVRRVLVPEAVVHDTLAVMRGFGQRGHEALVLWLGQVSGADATVEHSLAPPQQAIVSEHGVGYFVTSETLFHLNRTLAEHRLRLIAQVHSHPGDAYHSDADDQYAIVTEEGGLSLVVPDFGHAPADPAAWAVYRLVGRRWVDMPGPSARELITTAMPDAR